MTPEQKYWLKMRDDAEAAKPNAAIMFKNLATTVDGHLCIGMTLHKTRGYYSATYTKIDGVQSYDNQEWDLVGNSLTGFSDLDMTTINSGVRVI